MAAVNRRAPQRALTRRDNEFMGDLAAWERENGEDNSEQLERLRRNLRRVRRAELTPRQAQLLHLYYDLGYSPCPESPASWASTSPPSPGPSPGGGKD